LYFSPLTKFSCVNLPTRNSVQQSRGGVRAEQESLISSKSRDQGLDFACISYTIYKWSDWGPSIGRRFQRVDNQHVKLTVRQRQASSRDTKTRLASANETS
jgi:hypothetical protein